MLPRGLSHDTSRFCTSSGKGWRQKWGRPSQSQMTPPIPALAASVAPMECGASGTSSARHVGREQRSAARRAKARMLFRRCRPSEHALQGGTDVTHSAAHVDSDLVKRSMEEVYDHGPTFKLINGHGHIRREADVAGHQSLSITEVVGRSGLDHGGLLD